MKNEHLVEIKFTEEWIDALDKAFKKVSKEVEMDGFRKGSVPKNMFIKKYGVESLYEEAINILLEDQKDKLGSDDKLELIIRPVVDVKDVSEKEITISVKRITEPVVELGEYKNLGIKAQAVKVTKKELDEELENLRKENSDLVVKDKAIELKDTAVIDFAGVVDGEALEGGTGFDYSLEIGSNSFIPGFEEKLIGAKTGEERVINLTFPEDYHEHLKGKDVEFTVTIKEVKEPKLAEINKEFFEDLGYEVETEEEFRKALESNMLEDKTSEADKKKMDEVFELGIKNMKAEINHEIVEEEINNMVLEIEDSLKQQGMTLEMYAGMMGMDEKALHESLHKTAHSRVEVKYFLKNVAKAEGLKVAKKELNEKIEEFIAHTIADEKEAAEAKENKGLISYIESIILLEKASNFLKENN